MIGLGPHTNKEFGEKIMSEDEFEKEIMDKLAAINAEFDQFKAAMMEIAIAVSDYRKMLKRSRQFTKEEQFMLTMEYQNMILSTILTGNFGGSSTPEIPDFPPEDLE